VFACREVKILYAVFLYVYRACNYPGDVFQEVDSSVDLDSLMAKAYRLFDDMYECRGLSYNQHLWFEHTHESR
jgi:hypothetical protein